MSVVIALDIREVVHAADALNDAPAKISASLSRALNAQGKAIRKDSVSKIISRVQLTQSYVDPKVTVKQQATETKPEVVIAVPVRGTLLNRFPTYIKAIANVWTEAKYIEKMGSLRTKIRPNPNAPRMLWTPRTGYVAANVPVGKKLRGAAFAVKTGGISRMWSRAFFGRMLAGKELGSNIGVYTRNEQTGKLKARYGPSPHQVVKGVWQRAANDYTEKLKEAVLEDLGRNPIIDMAGKV